MRQLLSGKREGIPYSLSRWTDVPGAKWPWFREALAAGAMVAFDPRTAVPGRWSLAPEDTLGLVFWTKDPSNLLKDRELLRAYQVKVHVTVTGWVEVEKGAPDLMSGARLLRETVEVFGSQNVTWRFSPVPILPMPELLERFFTIATHAGTGLSEVFVSFLQTNDLMPESRDADQRRATLVEMAKVVKPLGLKVALCNEDRSPLGADNLVRGICAPPLVPTHPRETFGEGRKSAEIIIPQVEGCGCVLMADPFTINESCTFGCTYCYASDKGLADKKRNTTRRSLEVVG